MNISWNGRKYNDDEYDNTLLAPFKTLNHIIRQSPFIPVTERVFTLGHMFITSINGVEYWFRKGTYTIHSNRIVYIPSEAVYDRPMNTTHKEKRIDEVTLDEAFNALNAVDYITDFKRQKVGRVDEWIFTVKGNATTLSNTTNLIIHVPAGTYTLVRDARTMNWVTLMLPEDFNE